MNFKSKSLFLCSFELIKGNVARNTNSQVHRLHLATAPMGTLVTGFEYKLNDPNKPQYNLFLLINLEDKFVYNCCGLGYHCAITLLVNA